MARRGVWWSPSQEAMLLVLVAFGAGFAAPDTMFTNVIPDAFGMRAIGAIMDFLVLDWRAGAALRAVQAATWRR